MTGKYPSRSHSNGGGANSAGILPLDRFAPELAFVLERGFVVREGEYFPEIFGNAHLVLDGPFVLKVTRDRGQIFVDFGDREGGWIFLNWIVEFMDSREVWDKLEKDFPGYPLAASSAGWMIGAWPRLIALFGDADEVHKLREFADQRQKAFYEGMMAKARDISASRE